MNTIEKRFQALKPWDEVQCTRATFILDENGTTKELAFIITAGHGYLVIPKDWKHGASIVANNLGKQFNFSDKHAFYLEEDCEAPKFLELL